MASGAEVGANAIAVIGGSQKTSDRRVGSTGTLGQLTQEPTATPSQIQLRSGFCHIPTRSPVLIKCWALVDMMETSLGHHPDEMHTAFL